MKTIKKVEVTPIWVELIPENIEEGKLYISIEYKTAIHKCLCGCGNLSVTPLSRGQWFLTDIENKVTLTPSILNTNCPNRSHYILTKNIANFV
jgi:hypothetical protein